MTRELPFTSVVFHTEVRKWDDLFGHYLIMSPSADLFQMLSLSFSWSFWPSTVVAVALVTDILKSENRNSTHQARVDFNVTRYYVN